MTELSEEIKDMLKKDIDASNIQGLYKTLEIILGRKENPNVIPVEFKLSTIEYLEEVRDDLSRSSKGAMEYDLAQVVELMITMSIPAYRKQKKGMAKARA